MYWWNRCYIGGTDGPPVKPIHNCIYKRVSWSLACVSYICRNTILIGIFEIFSPILNTSFPNWVSVSTFGTKSVFPFEIKYMIIMVFALIGDDQWCIYGEGEGVQICIMTMRYNDIVSEISHILKFIPYHNHIISTSNRHLIFVDICFYTGSGMSKLKLTKGF